jgi:hypothetical protein
MLIKQIIWIIDIKDCYLNNGTPDKPSCSGFTIACQCNDGKEMIVKEQVNMMKSVAVGIIGV